MNLPSYLPPIDKLLSFGDCRENLINKWPNYLEEIGIREEHIPELIRMATDEELNREDEDELENWAPVHAWRALGQLRAEEAIEPLMHQFHELENHDYFTEEIPEVYGLIGPAAIPALKAYLADKSHDIFPRVTACRCLEKIAKHHPDVRDECVAIVTQQLEKFVKNNPLLNGFLISSLIHLQAVESAPVIERAFAAKRVEKLIVGDWDKVRVYLGLLSELELHQLKFDAANRPIVEFSAASFTQKQKSKGFIQGKSKIEKNKHKNNK